MKITKRRVDALVPADAVYWDDELRCFGIRVKPSGVKSYVVQYRNAQGNSKRVTIGQHDPWSPEQARDRAKELLRMADDAKKGIGVDPAEAKQLNRQAITVEELCREYQEKLDAGLILGRKGKPKKTTTVYNDKRRIETGHHLAHDT